MSDAHKEATHIAASLEAALRRSAGRGKRRVPAPTETYAAPSRAIAQTELAADDSPVEACELCNQSSERAETRGKATTGILFVGEVPDMDELARSGPDEPAGDQFLTRIIENGIGVKRADVYIMKLIKRAPSADRLPHPGELALCSTCLTAEIARIAPKVVVPLGEHAARELTSKALPLERLRSERHVIGGRPVIPTYSPITVLKKEGSSDFAQIKKLVWEDIKRAMSEAGITPGHK